MKIGFIGLGNMGGPMARNLLKAGHQLTVSDLSQSAVAGLVEAGATAAASIAELARSDVEMIITMLPAAPHVKGVYLGEDGLLAHVAPHVRLIEDRKSTRLNSSHVRISYAVFCLKKKK